MIISSLINAFSTLSSKVVLILDDYHTIVNSSIHKALTFLLDYLPHQLHIMLAARSEPPLAISLLRGRRQLRELRADELRFTLEETLNFLRTIPGFAFSEEEAALLEERTEGWIAGLHLAALSLRHQSDSVAFITAFADSHRYILDYLSEEVISQQIEEVQQFLLHTSVLDRLSGSLCDAVTGQSRSQSILEQLEQANLFIVSLDDERGWYRYHHLLSDVLRRQLQQSQHELIPQLHHRAAVWYEQHGFIAETVNHRLAAADYDEAARTMEQVADTMLARGERQTLQHWLESLPIASLRQSPRLCITYALLLIWLCQLDSAES